MVLGTSRHLSYLFVNSHCKWQKIFVPESEGRLSSLAPRKERKGFLACLEEVSVKLEIVVDACSTIILDKFSLHSHPNLVC